MPGTGLDVLTNWDRRSQFYLEAIDQFGEVRHGDPHWMAVQFMKTMKVDREAAKLLLQTMRDREDKHALVDAFTMPTLVVCGDQDDDNGSAVELAGILPNAQYAEIPGTHMSSITRKELGEEIASFLSRLTKRNGRLTKGAGKFQLLRHATKEKLQGRGRLMMKFAASVSLAALALAGCASTPAGPDGRRPRRPRRAAADAGRSPNIR